LIARISGLSPTNSDIRAICGPSCPRSRLVVKLPPPPLHHHLVFEM
jgi:hypothetical protein